MNLSLPVQEVRGGKERRRGNISAGSGNSRLQPGGKVRTIPYGPVLGLVPALVPIKVTVVSVLTGGLNTLPVTAQRLRRLDEE